MRTAIVIGTSIAVLTGAVVAGADQTKADKQFCAAAAEFRVAVADLQAIGPHSTVSELRAATERVDKPVNDMQKAAKKMSTPTAKHFTESMKQLDQDVNSIPNDATLEQVRSRIRDDIQAARSSGQQVAAEAGCPVAEPPPQQR